MYSVLMVDDNAAIREALARSLTRRGCRVTTAASGVEGLQALTQRSFDVVITDLNMPERGGLWLWRQALVLRPELRGQTRSEEHTSELQSHSDLVCRLLLEKKKRSSYFMSVYSETVAAVCGMCAARTLTGSLR